MGCEVLRDEPQGLIDDVFVAAAAFEPVHARFAPEPGELAFGVVAMALLGLGDGLLPCQVVLQDRFGFGVAERCEGPTVRTVARDESLCFFDESAVEHGGGPLVDAFVEAGTRRVEAEAEDAVASEGVTTLLPLLCQRSFRSE